LNVAARAAAGAIDALNHTRFLLPKARWERRADLKFRAIGSLAEDEKRAWSAEPDSSAPVRGGHESRHRPLEGKISNRQGRARTAGRFAAARSAVLDRP